MRLTGIKTRRRKMSMSLDTKDFFISWLVMDVLLTLGGVSFFFFGVFLDHLISVSYSEEVMASIIFFFLIGVAFFISIAEIAKKRE